MQVKTLESAAYSLNDLKECQGLKIKASFTCSRSFHGCLNSKPALAPDNWQLPKPSLLALFRKYTNTLDAIEPDKIKLTWRLEYPRFWRGATYLITEVLATPQANGIMTVQMDALKSHGLKSRLDSGAPQVMKLRLKRSCRS